MRAFRILLASIFISILGYTGIVAWNHGFGLLPVFFGDIAKMGWPGQFNFDFMSLLVLSGLWLAWRHHFSPGSGRVSDSADCPARSAPPPAAAGPFGD